MFLTTWKLTDFGPGEGRAAGAATPDYDDKDWLPVAVPGDVHSTLKKAGLIADPFYDQNELECRWVEEREWWYRATFDGPIEPLLASERLRLIFHGLDTFVTIWLNGVQLGRHQNMFRPAEFDVSAALKTGQLNTLALCFDRPQDHIPASSSLVLWDETTQRVFMRKAQYGYGWDWGPRLPTIGIWREVELVHDQLAVLKDVSYRTLEIDPNRAWAALAVTIEVERLVDVTTPLQIRLRLLAPDKVTEVFFQHYSVSVSETGLSQLEETVLVKVAQPQLWWTHDLGTPGLYRLEVELYAQNQLVDQASLAVGIRTVELDRSPDHSEPGTSFFRFVLNGQPIFAKGANWIPADSLVATVKPERYQQLLTATRDANMNMLRVWGGGIYEPDRFYELCDELGILVWQDFMFACAPYPQNDPAFRAEVEAEAVYQVRRLGKHPSLAVWCGNNENQWLHDTLHWPQNGLALVPGAYFYHELLPAIVARYSPTVPYWPGSPFGGNDHNSMDEGDRHNWDVWHGNRPFRRRFGEQPRLDKTPAGVDYHNYNKDMGRFISEFGLHAAPVLATLQKVIPPDQLYRHSPALDHHNKDNPKNKGDNLMLNVTGLPDDLAQYIDFSMIAQAEGLKFALEHYRRRMPHCSGTLVWQLNDCWPGLSWSLVDYYGVGKAGYYYVKRAYWPVLASFRSTEEGGVELWITNDRPTLLKDSATLRLASFRDGEVWKETIELEVAPRHSQLVWQAQNAYLQAAPNNYLTVRSSRDSFPFNRHFFVDIKDLSLPRAGGLPALHYKQLNSRELEVTLYASEYKYFVQLASNISGTSFSDNYFDLEADYAYRVRVSHPSQQLSPDSLTYRTY